ncbi:hypothetical protein ASD8599_00490 [Ascidiaceihabitans donghaensis]|uniref:Uncharacterized protein n=1 Tax=Ascidiaceihabitans donghaensis TaxID=1510460 RepID=A0A2R8BA44_9RHOB|nr:hypothetical protein [Ascidiaceihabitans donghaensis]SPH19755.1 hypothetical protein ASD8599_00490 [Ascidiaceihabitans donghaensis]
MKLFTFVVDRDGETYISQQRETTYELAALAFIEESVSCEFRNLQDNAKPDLFEQMVDYTPITNTENTFCVSFVDNRKKLWLITIVETVPAQEKGNGT